MRDRRMKPNLIFCWQNSSPEMPSNFRHLELLLKHKAVLLTGDTFPVSVTHICDSSLCPDIYGPTVKETDIPTLIRMLHGVSCGKTEIANKFLAYLERTRPEDEEGKFKFI